MSPDAARPRRRAVRAGALVLAGAVLLAAASCGGGGEGAGDGGGPAGTSGPPSARPPRDARLVQAQEAYEHGQPDTARTLLDQASSVDPVDRVALEARLSLASGSPVDALRALEKAKERWPDDGRIYSAEAEVYAVMGRLPGAEDAIHEGLRRAGACAELARAQAVVALSIPGGAAEGMKRLESARALDPDLPYMHHVGAQADLLVGRQELAADAPDKALEHARAALAWDPSDPDYRELEADALAGLLRYDEAIARYTDLQAEGRDVGGTIAHLHQQAAMAALLAKDRAKAVEHYLAARKAGLSDEELGFGANVLRQEADKVVDDGVTRYEADDLDGARARFEHALELDPENLAARNHLGVVLFRQGDHAGAAKAWKAVLEEAKKDGVELPEPVHLNLARALFLDGDAQGARDACDAYLDARPDGEWAKETRDMLVRLEEARLAADSGAGGR